MSRRTGGVARGLLGGALVTALAAMAFLVLNPSAQVPAGAVRGTSDLLRDLGLSGWVVDTDVWEFVYNVLLFVPVAAVCALLWRQVPVRDWVVLGFLASAAIETTQLVFLAGRSAQVRDLVSNTTGALLGALLGRWAGTVGGRPRGR